MNAGCKVKYSTIYNDRGRKRAWFLGVLNTIYNCYMFAVCCRLLNDINIKIIPAHSVLG